MSMFLVVVIFLTFGTNIYAEDPGGGTLPRIPRIVVPCPEIEE